MRGRGTEKNRREKGYLREKKKMLEKKMCEAVGQLRR